MAVENAYLEIILQFLFPHQLQNDLFAIHGSGLNKWQK